MMMSGRVYALQPGDSAPDFTLKSIEAKEIRLSDYQGQLVLLKLATTWCPTCKQLSGEIAKAGEFLAENKVVYLEIFVRDSESTVVDYVAELTHPMTYHALMDDGQAYRAYNVYVIPRLLLIDSKQVVRYDSAGQVLTAEDLVALVKEYGPDTVTKK